MNEKERNDDNEWMDEWMKEWRVFVSCVYDADWFGCNSIGWNDNIITIQSLLVGQEESPVFSLVKKLKTRLLAPP
jgi:hypothetical protein